jgi:aspartate/methionine/tyrosine aminotransferase
LNQLGFKFNLPEGTFYFWVEVGGSSIKFVDFLLENGKIVSTPGVGFGPSGEGYVRFSLTIDEEKIKKAIERMKKIWQK